MKRRTFIFLSVAGAAAIAVPFASCNDYSDSTVKTLAQPEFLTHICDDKTLRDIGSAYRSRTSDESDQDRLVSLLLAGHGSNKRPSNPASDNTRLIEQLDSAIREDYTASRIVTIRGWVLSLTEARQCALYSLSQQ